jgi:hypothetical protein
METENWKLENGNWKLETAKRDLNWKLETGKGKLELETGRPKLDGGACTLLKSEISNLKFPIGVSTTQSGAGWAVCEPPDPAPPGAMAGKVSGCIMVESRDANDHGMTASVP